MAISEKPPSDVDLEQGAGGGQDEGSACFSDEGSCNSQSYSTAEGDDYSSSSFVCGSDQILENEGVEYSRRASSSSSSSSMADTYPSDLETGLGGANEKSPVQMGINIESKDCRICHLSLVNSSPAPGIMNMIPIELGCSCKDDLAAAHKHCAETWFKIKGDKTCEICNSVARNVVGPNDAEAAQQQQQQMMAGERDAIVMASAETRSCVIGHRLLNLVLACMVFAFVISWLFHFNIPS